VPASPPPKQHHKNWLRCTTVQIPLLAYSAKTAGWLLVPVKLGDHNEQELPLVPAKKSLKIIAQ